MTGTVRSCAVLFADIAGSTRLYEEFGDSRAQDMVTGCLLRLTESCVRHHGKVVKTVGDEIMCWFPTPDDAVNSAQEMHDLLREREQIDPQTPSVRIGLHFGEAIFERNDIFGDAVNLAARMTAVAKARQIITTESTVDRLSAPLSASTRLFDRATVPGRQGEVTMYEVLWEGEDATHIISRVSLIGSETMQLLRVSCGESEELIGPDALEFTIGRGAQRNLVVPSELASRLHGRIEFRRGKYVYVDLSTNGTFIRSQDGQETYLRREEMPLWGSGFISLGRSVTEGDPNLIRFSCE